MKAILRRLLYPEPPTLTPAESQAVEVARLEHALEALRDGTRAALDAYGDQVSRLVALVRQLRADRDTAQARAAELERALAMVEREGR